MPSTKKENIGIVFSGGPAPAANAVISSTAISFMEDGHSVIGLYDGYTHLVNFDKNKNNLKKGIHYRILEANSIGRIRNQRGVFIRTARENPGKTIKNITDLKNKRKVQKLQNTIDGLRSLGISLLISIGGDDTLRTANLINLMGMDTIHIPKTIDNDYFGIPWTFGYWTSVNVIQKTILNLRSDAASTGGYFIAEIMGRKTGWLTYAGGIAGEAIDMISIEDIDKNEKLNLNKMCSRLVDTILIREKDGKNYGIICVAEGLADKLPEELLPKEKDAFGHTALGKAEIGKIIANEIIKIYKKRTNKNIKVNAKQIGYETRTAAPISFDVVLSSALGYGAWKLWNEQKSGHMVSVLDNFNIKGIPFSELIDPETLTTKIRFVPNEEDLYKIKNILSYKKI